MAKYGLDNYIGIYRVRPALTAEGELSDNMEDNYIHGKNGVSVFRFDATTLALFVPHAVYANKILKEFESILRPIPLNNSLYTDFDANSIRGEQEIYFKETDIHKLNNLVSFETLGKSISPRSIKNLPKSKSTYNPKNPELMESLRSLIKQKLTQLKGDDVCIQDYLGFYKELESKLNIPILQSSRKERLKFIEYLDKYELLEKAKGCI